MIGNRGIWLRSPWLLVGCGYTPFAAALNRFLLWNAWISIAFSTSIINFLAKHVVYHQRLKLIFSILKIVLYLCSSFRSSLIVISDCLCILLWVPRLMYYGWSQLFSHTRNQGSSLLLEVKVPTDRYVSYAFCLDGFTLLSLAHAALFD